jgi:hypothetical protein
MRLAAGRLRVARPMALRVVGSADWLPAAARQAAAALNAAAGREIVSDGGRGPAMTVSDMATPPAGVRPVARAEGYVLSVTERGAHLAGADAAGVFYGAQTLAQLVSGDAIPAARVRDWPRFEVRGVHLYMPAREHLDFFWRFLDFLAALKCNTVFLEVGGGMEYERHPEINRAWRGFCREAMSYDFHKDRRIPESKTSRYDPHWAGRGPVALQASRYFAKDSTHTELAGGEWLTKDEVRRIARECRRRHIRIIPEVQCLSHSYYLCCAHPEIAEHHEDPWPDTYCPSNPKSYELYRDVVEEVVEVLKPEAVSIGHDEAYTFRICPRCRKRAAHDILADEITRVHDILAGLGVRTMMWGDKLMNITTPEGRRYGGIARRRRDPATGKTWVQPATWKAVEKTPKDIWVLDWYWSLDPRSERNFHRHGFEVVYGNFSPLKFPDWESRAGTPFVHGAEMSSWCGVTAYEFGHNATFYQFFPGADMLWRGLQMPKERVCPLMARRMTPAVEAMTRQDRWLVGGVPGRIASLDLSTVSADLPPDLAGRLKCWPEAKTVLGTGGFAVAADGRGALTRAVVLSKAGPRRSVTIPVGRKARRLVALHGVTMKDVYARPTYYSYHRGPAEVLQYRVTYADGRKAVLKAAYHDNIGQVMAAWPDGGHCYQAVPVEAGRGATLYAAEWPNPRPAAVIREITVRLGPDATAEGVALVAAMGVIA